MRFCKRGSSIVRFAPKATKLLRRHEMTRWADFVVKVAGEPGTDRTSTISRLAAVRTRHLRCATDGSELEKDATNPTLGSRNARGWRDRRWPCDQLCEPAKVLCDRRQRELELRTARPAQSQAAEPQDALQMCEQHLNTLPVTA